MRRDRGSAAVELVLLTPVLMALALLVVAAGRGGVAVTHVRHAADQGARAASMVDRDSMEAEARRAVSKDLVSAGVSCDSTSVSVSTGVSGRTSTVTVQVQCTLSRQGLRLLRIGSRAVSASSTEVIDRYRGGS